MAESARPAVEDDVGVLVTLCATVRSVASSERGGAQLVEELRLGDLDAVGVRAVLDDPHATIFLGSYDEVPVGIAIVRHAPGSRAAELRLLFVEQAARDVGIGEALLERCVTWSDEQGCQGLDVTVLPGDRETKSLLEAHGFKARLITMHGTVSRSSGRSERA